MDKVLLVPGPSRDVRRFNRDEASYTKNALMSKSGAG